MFYSFTVTHSAYTVYYRSHEVHSAVRGQNSLKLSYENAYEGSLGKHK